MEKRWATFWRMTQGYEWYVNADNNSIDVEGSYITFNYTMGIADEPTICHFHLSFTKNGNGEWVPSYSGDECDSTDTFNGVHVRLLLPGKPVKIAVKSEMIKKKRCFSMHSKDSMSELRLRTLYDSVCNKPVIETKTCPKCHERIRIEYTPKTGDFDWKKL